MLGDRAWSAKYRDRQLETAGELIRACFDHYALKMYLVISVTGLIALVASGGSVFALLLATALTVGFYPLVEYVLHRFVLHSHLLYRSPITAPLWRRLHYDHHMKPSNLTVLFAAPVTSVPLLIVLALIPGAVIDVTGLFPAMITTNFLMFTYYEFMHASAHLKLGFHSNWIARHRQSHLRHHFISETQNYGIGTQLMDRIAGTDNPKPRQSPTVRNLGYDDNAAAAFPWVRESYERDENKA
ncbi:sterol desaturase family protein [Hoeflea sp.]|uniref:sterol desaturase family protein n=1 Tax=Hoeflea sp. TaxID=1940281 RepID=UPI003B51CED5